MIGMWPSANRYPVHDSDELESVCCWLWPIGVPSTPLALTSLTIKLPYCDPHDIDNFFCDVPQVIKLACTNTHIIEILIVSNSGLISVWSVLWSLWCPMRSSWWVWGSRSQKAEAEGPVHLRGPTSPWSHSFWDTASSSIPGHPPASQRTRWCLCFSPLSHPAEPYHLHPSEWRHEKCLEQINGEGKGKRKEMKMSKPLWCLVFQIKEMPSKDMLQATLIKPYDLWNYLQSDNWQS